MLSNLNTQQREAVLTISGPVMVFAGAGSGKTRTLTYRVAYMIKEVGIPPHSILAITFTNRATNEMRERLLNLVGTKSYEVTISTFHSLCARILRKEINVLGYNRSFTIIDEDDQLKIINSVVKDLNLERKKYPGKALQKKFNYYKCHNSKPRDLEEVRLLNAYEAVMKERNLLDFEDLLLKVHEIFMNFSNVLEKYTEIFKYVLVDEFQDTNLVQYQIVKMLTEKSRNIFVVGDDDQSIYSFRGTNYENMNLFKKDFPENKIFHLTQNYRSTQKILDGCNLLIANNLNREKKELFSEVEGSDNDVKIYQAYNEKVEVDYILDEIFSLKLRGAEYSDFAILYRNSVLMRNLELGLIQMGLSYQVFGGVSYLRRREIKDIIAYFKFIVNHDDVHSFQRIVNLPSRLIGDTTVNKVLEIRKKYHLNIFEAIDACKTLIREKTYLALVGFRNLIMELKDMFESESLIAIYEMLLDKIKYREYLKQEENYEERLENIEEFKSILIQIEEEGTDLSRLERLEAAFDDAILADDKLQNQRQNREGITLSTIHSVKGLEFNYVFVIGLEENVFPNSYRFEKEDELEEERRIAYVAFTRAKKKLYLLSAQNRLLYGERFSNKVSRFVLEFSGLNNEFLEADHFFEKDEPKIDFKQEVKKTEKIKYQIGDKIVHKVFGPGMIIAIDKEIGQIFFDKENSLKKIDLNHPSLWKKER